MQEWVEVTLVQEVVQRGSDHADSVPGIITM